MSTTRSWRQRSQLQIKKPTDTHLPPPPPEPFVFSSLRPVTELDAAVTALQNVYRSYRTRRNLADCAVVIEELWWKTLEVAAKKEPNILNARTCERNQIDKLIVTSPEPFVFSSPRPVTELDAAATTLQKVYRSYRTRKNLADCVVVVEKLWWKILEVAAKKEPNTMNGRNCENSIQIDKPTVTSSEPFVFTSPRPVTELDAVTMLQK